MADRVARADRVFCPLEAVWFNLIQAGNKHWEFRRMPTVSSRSPVASQVLKRWDFKRCDPLPIEFRYGYRPGKSCWKQITDVCIWASSLDVPAGILHDGCVTQEDLRKLCPDEVMGIKFVDEHSGGGRADG